MSEKVQVRQNIVFYSDRVCLYGDVIEHATHQHYLVQIVVYFDENSQKVFVEKIGSNQLHSMIQCEGRYFSILVDPMSNMGKILDSKK